MEISYTLPDQPNTETYKTFLCAHGQNQWNYLPQDVIDAEFELLNQGSAKIISAVHDNNLAGFSLCLLGESAPQYLNKYGPHGQILFVAEVVVASEYSGNGIATQLLKLSIDLARSEGLNSVFATRHEENPGSTGMMRKAGFEHVETFPDPEKRFSGSRKTTIMKYDID